MTLGARGPELTSLNVAKNFRTDLPPDAGPLRESAPETSPYAVWGMFSIMAVIVVLFVVSYLLGK